MNARPRLVLGSGSPRRAKLLRDSGYAFEQVTPPFDDSSSDLSLLPPGQMVAALAYRKAASVAEGLCGGVVLSCDTLLSVDGAGAGKPEDECDARRVLRLLTGRAHEVVTGVFLIDTASNRQTVFVDSARVTLGPVSDEALDLYLRSGRWRGKAGGYNLGEPEPGWKFDVEGDPTTVIGLPMERLRLELERFAPDVLPTP